MKRYAAGFLFSPNKKNVVLIRKNKPDWLAGKLNAIGGHVEDGETPAECMRREFLEEAGLYIDWWTHFCRLEGNIEGYDNFLVDFFYAISPNYGNVQSITSEKVEIHSIEHTSDRMCNLQWLIPMALSMKEDRAEWFNMTEFYQGHDFEYEKSAKQTLEHIELHKKIGF